MLEGRLPGVQIMSDNSPGGGISLAVSKSGYYHWLKSGPNTLWKENQKLSSLIKDNLKIVTIAMNLQGYYLN